MDVALEALSRSSDPVLHAVVSADVPTLPVLCRALDASGIAPPPALAFTSADVYRPA